MTLLIDNTSSVHSYLPFERYNYRHHVWEFYSVENFTLIIIHVQEPHILVKGNPDKEVHLCVKDLLFKVKDGQTSPKYEWRVDEEKIISDGVLYKDESDYKMERDKNTYKLSILKFDSKLEGKYECVVSTSEEPIVSTYVIFYPGKYAGMLCALVQIG